MIGAAGAVLVRPPTQDALSGAARLGYLAIAFNAARNGSASGLLIDCLMRMSIGEAGLP